MEKGLVVNRLVTEKTYEIMFIKMFIKMSNRKDWRAA